MFFSARYWWVDWWVNTTATQPLRRLDAERQPRHSEGACLPIKSTITISRPKTTTYVLRTFGENILPRTPRSCVSEAAKNCDQLKSIN